MRCLNLIRVKPQLRQLRKVGLGEVREVVNLVAVGSENLQLREVLDPVKVRELVMGNIQYCESKEVTR